VAVVSFGPGRVDGDGAVPYPDSWSVDPVPDEVERRQRRRKRAAVFVPVLVAAAVAGIPFGRG
jgi:hypothetical protein